MSTYGNPVNSTISGIFSLSLTDKLLRAEYPKQQGWKLLMDFATL